MFQVENEGNRKNMKLLKHSRRVNKFARAVTKWTRVCDKTFGTSDLFHSSHRVNSNNLVMWKIQNNSADWDRFWSFILQEILKT